MCHLLCRLNRSKNFIANYCHYLNFQVENGLNFGIIGFVLEFTFTLIFYYFLMEKAFRLNIYFILVIHLDKN